VYNIAVVQIEQALTNFCNQLAKHFDRELLLDFVDCFVEVFLNQIKVPPLHTPSPDEQSLISQNGPTTSQYTRCLFGTAVQFPF
jgi:hypothetical protein